MLFRGTMFSEVLEMSMHIAFVGPWTLAEPPARVCYLLHGLCGNSECWIDYTRLRQYAEGRHTLFIMPEAARSFYTDMRYGGQFFTYLTDELPRQCAKLFRIPQGREHTAILGCSAGGYGALKAALGCPEQYGACAALSPCCLMLGEDMDNLRQMPTEQAEELWGRPLMRDMNAIFGPELALCPQDNPIRLAERAARAGDAPKLYLTCGLQDCFLNDCRHYHEILSALHITHTYTETEGAHNWDTFDLMLRQALDWLDAEMGT